MHRFLPFPSRLFRLCIALIGLTSALPAVSQTVKTPALPKTKLVEGSELRVLSVILKGADRIEPSAVEFMRCPDFSVEVVFRSDAPSVKITEAEVRAWTMAEIARSAPHAKIVSAAEQKDRMNHPTMPLVTISTAMLATDAAERCFRLAVAVHEDPKTKDILYIAHMDLRRGAFVPSGLGSPVAYSQASHNVLAPDDHPEKVIHEAIVGLVQDFAEKWTIANKPAFQAQSPVPVPAPK